MDQQTLKQKVAEATVTHLNSDIVLGIGSGSTVLCFIQALRNSNLQIQSVVAASSSSASALEQAGYSVTDLNNVNQVDIYIDSCDEIDATKSMIKGGGAALTREKIIAAASKTFICIADVSKKVEILGKFPLPVEIIPMARRFVMRELEKLGGKVYWREGVVTDNGNWIVDIEGLSITEPDILEKQIGTIAGVVTVGIFAQNRADKVIMSEFDGKITVW